jgi:hypothetical protein
MSEFRDKVLGLGVISGRTSVRVQDIRDDTGRMVGKDVTDELNNTVHVRDDSQGLTLRPKTIELKTVVQ